MDINMIHAYLAQSYWAKDIPKSLMQKAMENSLCFGVFRDNGEQVGFARVITDKATFAYLADVFILEPLQRKGLGSWLISEILKHPGLQGLRRFNLATRDAHEFYRKFGFEALSEPQKLMEKTGPDIKIENC